MTFILFPLIWVSDRDFLLEGFLDLLLDLKMIMLVFVGA